MKRVIHAARYCVELISFSILESNVNKSFNGVKN